MYVRNDGIHLIHDWRRHQHLKKIANPEILCSDGRKREHELNLHVLIIWSIFQGVVSHSRPSPIPLPRLTLSASGFKSGEPRLSQTGRRDKESAYQPRRKRTLLIMHWCGVFVTKLYSGAAVNPTSSRTSWKIEGIFCFGLDYCQQIGKVSNRTQMERTIIVVVLSLFCSQQGLFRRMQRKRFSLFRTLKDSEAETERCCSQ